MHAWYLISITRGSERKKCEEMDAPFTSPMEVEEENIKRQECQLKKLTKEKSGRGIEILRELKQTVLETTEKRNLIGRIVDERIYERK